MTKMENDLIKYLGWHPYPNCHTKHSKHLGILVKTHPPTPPLQKKKKKMLIMATSSDTVLKDGNINKHSEESYF